MDAPTRRIDSLQAGRALAAFAVLLSHDVQSVEAHVGALPATVSAILTRGYLGVDFFFVLSGFIIYFTNARKRDEPGWLRQYLRSRLVRIYPPYLPVGIAMAAAYLALPGLSGGGRSWQWLPSLTLFPAGTPALAVAWTLQHEMTFYVFMAAALYLRQVFAACLVWAVLILVLGSGIPLATINLEFLFGIFAAWCYMEGRFRLPIVQLAVAAAAIAAYFIIGSDAYRMLFGLGMAAIVLPVVRWEKEGRLRVPGFLVQMGAESYALYLLHLPILVFTARFCPALGLSQWAALVALPIPPIIASKLYYRFYEQPILRRFERPRARAAEPSAEADQLGNSALEKPPQASS
jgi:peptidoglycan/LPS O-acetylase OafA/YrhL